MPLNESSISEINLDNSIDENFQQKRNPITERASIKKNNLIQSENEPREEIYSCFCVKLNETFKSNTFIKTCISSMCGFPVYIIVSLLLLAIGTVAAIATLYQLKVQASVVVNRSYFMNCSSNSDCDSLKGLQCSAADSLCNCPAIKTKGYCDCSVGYYWSGVECKRLMQYLNTGCSANYMCDNTKNLQCLNKTCKCDPLKIFDSTTQKCKYNFIGCYNDNTSPLATITATYRMNYFVDICINGCKYKNYTYSIFLTSGSRTNCYCTNTYVSTSLLGTQFCDALCLGKSGEALPCGSAANSYRSIYLNYGS
jgi:hypothetical protein